MNKTKNIFSVDIEDWFVVKGFEKFYEISDKHIVHNNLIANINLILDVLKESNTIATFFVLAKLVEILPEVIEILKDTDHEIALHGYDHTRVDVMNDYEFQKDIEISLNILQRHNINDIKGFRAPEFSIDNNNFHYLKYLKEFGFEYDSSIYPISLHPNYGSSVFPTEPFFTKYGIIEFPIATTKMFGVNFPCGGGAYFRFLNYYLFKKFFLNCNKTNVSCVYYIHPWEFGHSVPKESMKYFLRFRQKYNIKNNRKKLRKLLNDITFTNFVKYLKDNENYVKEFGY